ncbi:hypothetical protein C2G38_2163844 [Gigaspora rosea]|uniref:Secreted protein n=1 Tax=Gigaspora rosea TaxID=44941 RepID=A0A397W4A5_9GLOM|nr:hypothetical protein C2G38_2163844 [Gigaspora rosea]
MNSHIFILTFLIICCLVTSKVDGTEIIIISALAESTQCRSFVTNCRGQKIFERDTQDCGGSFCVLSRRPHIPDDQPTCLHMSILSTNDKVKDQRHSITNENELNCYLVAGNSDSNSFTNVPCPDHSLLSNCSNPNIEENVSE